MFSGWGPRYFSKVAERSQSESTRAIRRGLRRVLLVLITVLYIVAVPWYREPGGELHLIWGLPDWVAVALGCYASVAILNSLAWLLTEIEDPEDSDPGPGEAT